MILINPYSLSLLNKWEVTSTNDYTKVEGSNNSVNLSATVNGGALASDWFSAENTTHFSSPSSCSFNLPITNTITSNPSSNGMTVYVRADCYDASNSLRGYVGFAYIFFNTGSTKLGVYITRNDAGLTTSEQSSALSVPAFNGSDVFTLSVNPSTREWEVDKGGNKADGDVVLGLMPLYTDYVKYTVVVNVGASVQGSTEIDVLSIS